MVTTATTDTVNRTIQVYFLASPEDHAVCEDIIKHLKPVVRSSPIPIDLNSDFNIPSGADREQYKQRLFEADIVLALISVDFINDDDIYSRNQKVIERYNNRETVMIPILVRNCMWKATPFVSLPVVPRNLQPLNNKQFWNSQDDAVMAVVNDIYAVFSELAQAQREAAQPLSPASDKNTPDLKPVEELPEIQAEHDLPQKEAAETVDLPVVEALPEPLISQTESPEMKPEPAQAPQSSPAAKVESAPVQKTFPGTSSGSTTSWQGSSTPIAVDWREKYYLIVTTKRALAILMDYTFIVFVSYIIALPFYGTGYAIEDIEFAVMIFLYFVIMPIMESSKWQGTIGKRILKLQITDRDGGRITFLRAVWRNIMRSLVLYLFLGLLLLSSIFYLCTALLLIIPIVQYFRFKKTRKFFHDELSGTVIGERLASAGA